MGRCVCMYVLLREDDGCYGRMEERKEERRLIKGELRRGALIETGSFRGK